MATLLLLVDPPNDKIYLDKSTFQTPADQRAAVTKSATIYVGNLSFFTTEEQLHELFAEVGLVERIIMGLHRVERTPCGFCFIEFRQVSGAIAAARYLNGATLDGRVLKIERDPGFKEGRQYGRARSGGQVRDEVRTGYDGDRGGLGVNAAADAAASEPGPHHGMLMPMGGARGGPRGSMQTYQQLHAQNNKQQSNMMLPVAMGGPSGRMPIGGPSGGGRGRGGHRGPGTTFLSNGPPMLGGPGGNPGIHPMMQMHSGGGGGGSHGGRPDRHGDSHRGGGRGGDRYRGGGGGGRERRGGRDERGGNRFGQDRDRDRAGERDRDRDGERDNSDGGRPAAHLDEFGRDMSRRRKNRRFRERSDDEDED